MQIKDRLKVYAKEKGLSIRQFEREIGKSNGYVNSIVKDIGGETIMSILKAYPDLSINWVLTGEGEMLSIKKDDLQINQIYHPKYTERKEDQVSINLYDIEAAANLDHLFSNKDQHIIGKISIPNIPSCDGSIYVHGDSMYPLLKSGDIVAYKIVPNEIQYILFGEIYIVSIDILGDEYLSVKYIQKSEKGDDWIKLVSYNTHHQPKDFPLSSVRAMALVKFSIRMHTMK